MSRSNILFSIITLQRSVNYRITVEVAGHEVISLFLMITLQRSVNYRITVEVAGLNTP